MILLHNARIPSLEPDRPPFTALALEGGRVLACGGQELAQQFVRAEKRDMGGAVLLPGLTDAHIHLQEYAASLKRLDCELPTKAEILARLGEAAGQAGEGAWLRCHGWNQNTWGGAWPTAADLDAVAPRNPVYLSSKSLHAAWVNRLALEQAGITAESGDPPGGRIQRDERGRPTGVLFEKAVELVTKVIPEPPAEELAGWIRQALPRLWQSGLTGVHDFDKRNCFQALQILHARQDLRLRVVKSIAYEQFPHAVAAGLREGFGDDMLRIGPLKLFADGALGPRTAAMFEPFTGEPENRGMLLLDREQVFEIGARAGAAGLGLAVHAIGDRAVHEVLEGIARLRAEERSRGWPQRRHRIEHVQTIHPDDLGRLAELDVIASMQPVHAVSDMDMAEAYLGGRTACSYAARLQLERRARLAFGSDAPVESPDPFLGLHAAVTRRRPDGSPGPEGWHPELRLTVREALQAFTSGPAYAGYAEQRLGRLAPGCLADLIVLDEDPLEVEPERLIELRPRATMLGGEWVWEA